jgi:hypothetical protein
LHRRNRLALAILFPLAATGALAGCNRQAAQAPAPPATGAPIASLPLAQGAPPPAAVPSAPPLRVVRTAPRERYRYIDRAYALGEAFADSPPDYTVSYDGGRPWIWRSAYGDYRVIEPTPAGERIYYYDAGSDEPFLVRDPQYAYGYDQGQLAVIYDRDGRPIDYDPQAAEWAARYNARARTLYRAAVHEQREAAYAAAWRDGRDEVLAEQQAWAARQQRDAEWRAWRDNHRRREQPHWDAERAQRVAFAAQVAAQIAQAQRAEAPRSRSQPPGVSAPPPHPQDWRDRQAQAQRAQQLQQPPQAPTAQVQHQLQAREAAGARQQAQAKAARRAQAQAAQEAAARQQAHAAAGAQHQAQAEAARRTQAQAAHEAAARQQAHAAARAQHQAQAEAARRGQAQAAQEAAARQQARAAAGAQHQAQAEAARRGQAHAAQDAAKNAAAQAQQRAHPQRGKGQKKGNKPEEGRAQAPQ